MLGCLGRFDRLNAMPLPAQCRKCMGRLHRSPTTAVLCRQRLSAPGGERERAAMLKTQSGLHLYAAEDL